MSLVRNADYGLLDTVKEVLTQSEFVRENNLSVHLTLPQRPKYPLILLEVDEIWTDYTAGEYEAVARVHFRISMMSSSSCKKSLEVASLVEDMVDGKSMRLSPRYLANFRKTANVIDLPMLKSPRCVQHYYQSVILKRSIESMH